MAGNKSTRTRWRRAICVFLTLLTLFLIGTVVVLTTVVEYFGVDWRDIITEPEMRLYERLAAADALSRDHQRLAAAAQHVVSSTPGSSKEVADDASHSTTVLDLYEDTAPLAVDGFPPPAPGGLRAASKNDRQHLALSSETSDPERVDTNLLNKRSTSYIPATADEFAATLKSSPVPRIPRIIHATWKTDVVPERWQAARQGCMDLHPDYEFKLWSDAASREFIATYYDWFLSAFDGYTYPIQRADAIRYFVLHHYGGIYMDLDVGCQKAMDPLLYFQVILPATIPVGVSNDIMFSEKGHPFMDLVIHNLVTFNHQYGTNYPTVMFSTGPMFLSAQYGLWPKEDLSLAERQVRVLPRRWYGKNAPQSEMAESFFFHYYGSSWHADDAGFITFLGKFGMLLMYLGASIVIIGVGRMLWSKRRGKKSLTTTTRSHGPIALPFHLDGSALPYTRPDTPGSGRPDSPYEGSRSGSPGNSRRPSEMGPSTPRGVLYYLPVWLMPQDSQSRAGTPSGAQGPWAQFLYGANDEEAGHIYTPIPSYSRPPSPSNNSILHAPGSMHDGAFNGTPLKTMHHGHNDSIDATSPESSTSASAAVPPPEYSTLKGWSSFFRSPRTSFLPLSGQQPQQHQQQQQSHVFRNATADEPRSVLEYFETQHTASSGVHSNSAIQPPQFGQYASTGSRSPLPPHYTPVASPSSSVGVVGANGSSPNSTTASSSTKHTADRGIPSAVGGDHQPSSASSATTLVKGTAGELRGRGMVRSNSGQGLHQQQQQLGGGRFSATTSTSLEKAYSGGTGETSSGSQAYQQQQQYSKSQSSQQQQNVAFGYSSTGFGAVEPFNSHNADEPKNLNSSSS